jgi:hypothetical protein
MSAGELHEGCRPRARRPLTPLRRAVQWSIWLWLAAWLFCQVYYPESGWARLMTMSIVLLGLFAWLPAGGAGNSEEDEDWKERLTPARRLILLLLSASFAAFFIAFEYAAWAYELSPPWMDYLFPAGLVMLGLAALAWPRDPHSELDMRPVWAICAFLFAAVFFYPMLTS